jgi:hypothetical protein
MLVGVNYPWFDYGWDFGFGPPAWRGARTTPRWYPEIDRHLTHLHDLGVRIVRWFVLADGLTYGTGGQAPALDLASAAWHFDPPPVGLDVLDHFHELVQRFAAFNAAHQDPITLLPVLIDFHFCGPGIPILEPDPADPQGNVSNPDWIKQGRAEAIADAAKRQTFLDAVLEPLLQISQQNAEAVYAWELINEPDWVTNAWHPGHHRNDQPIDVDAMKDFLADGIERVQRAGFKATVGFALVETLLASGITAEVNQFHHYPGGTRVLPPQLFDPRFPAIVGEFATATNDVWPELGIQGQTILNRLRRADAQGYPAAIAWSFLANDRHTSWSRAVERDVVAFTRQQAGPLPSHS